MNKLIDLLKNNPDIINWNVDRWEESPQWTSITICYKKEVVEEPKKTLWDKRLSDTALCGPYVDIFMEGDVREALKEFIDWCETKAVEIPKGKHNFGYKGKAKDIFGEELIKNE